MTNNVSSENGLWTVFRMDDNSHTYLMKTRLKKTEADQIVEEFTLRGHHQIYWAERHDAKHDNPPEPYK